MMIRLKRGLVSRIVQKKMEENRAYYTGDAVSRNAQETDQILGEPNEAYEQLRLHGGRSRSGCCRGCS